MSRKKSKPSTEAILDELARKICWILADYTCARCGRKPTKNAHHAFSRNYRGDGVRWDQRNLVNLCYACHIHWAEIKHEEFRDWFIGRYGRRRWETIKTMAFQGRKLSQDDKDKLVATYTRQLQRLGGSDEFRGIF